MGFEFLVSAVIIRSKHNSDWGTLTSPAVAGQRLLGLGELLQCCRELGGANAVGWLQLGLEPGRAAFPQPRNGAARLLGRIEPRALGQQPAAAVDQLEIVPSVRLA